MKNKIGFLVLCSALFGLGSAEAAYVSVTDATSNSTRLTALNLDSKFDKNFDANIGNPTTNISTSLFHASVTATTSTSGSLDWYSFRTNQANVQAYFDIDNGMPDLDSWITLYDALGTQIAFNDDGGVLDSGSTSGWDSFLGRVLANPGLYYLSVGRYNGGVQSTLNAGQDYTLHVSLANQVPVPAAVWLFGSAIVGLMGFRRKNTVSAPLAV